jgi:precorrin-6B methylase 2
MRTWRCGWRSRWRRGGCCGAGAIHHFLVRNVGSGLRLVVCSRMDPLLRLHRYRVAGQLAEIRAGDLAFTTAEAGLLLARHGCTLTADLLECLMRRTAGWAAGLRLAALSLESHPDPGQFVKELIAEDSALTGYLVDEVLGAQPPQVREVLLCTSILDQVSADAAVELAGDEQARGIFSDAAPTNAFIQPIGSGRYRYHELFAEVLRLKLRRECPDRVAALHRRAARWHGRSGLLTDAVRHAARAGDWQLAADLVVDDLAIGQILQPHCDRPLAGEFAGMPPGQAWTGAQPHLVAAAVALSAGQLGSCAAALAAADLVLEYVPADRQAACGLAAAMIRLAASLRGGDAAAASAAAATAEALLSQIPAHKLGRHPEIRARILCGRGAVELWSGHLDEAARVLQAGTAGRAGSASEDDDRRTHDFISALTAAVQPGDIVLDIGTGSGVLAVALARAGARHVYAVEASDIAEVAARVFEANEVTDRVTLVPGWSKQIDLPERADLLVAEIIGNEPFEEETLETTLDARRRLLKPGARLVPHALELLARPLLLPEAEFRQRAFGRPAVERWRDLYGWISSRFSTSPARIRCIRSRRGRWSPLGLRPVLRRSSARWT